MFEKGDVVVIQGIPGHPHGHMAMYDGSIWISDFRQPDLYPGTAYRVARPSYKIYRYALLWDALETPPGASAMA